LVANKISFEELLWFDPDILKLRLLSRSFWELVE